MKYGQPFLFAPQLEFRTAAQERYAQEEHDCVLFFDDNQV